MKIIEKWNLGLLYKNDKDPNIEKDLKKIEKLCADFNKKYSKTDLSEKKNLLKSLFDFEQIKEDISGSKPWWYFALKTDIDGKNEYSISQKTKIESRSKKAGNNLTFFELNIAKIDSKKQKDIIEDDKFKKYKYFLKKIFKTAKYRLTEKEEKLENLLSQTSYDMWIDSNEKLLKEQFIEFKGEKMPISKVMDIISEMDKKDREFLQQKLNEKLKDVSHFAEAEINAIFNYKKTMDEMRGFQKPYSETILNYENEEKDIENLIKVITKNFKISNNFYNLHKKILGLEKLSYEDRSVKIGKINKKFSFENSVEIVREALLEFDPKYEKMFLSFISNGQFDIYPRLGKGGGAYCWGMGKMPTYILLNHNNEIGSVETLAHEMGHAIHTELSKEQPVFYRKYSISTAEVASTFFEQLVQNKIEEKLNKEEKIIFLHNKILGDISTVFRQIACFNFENELHLMIRKEGQVSKTEISKLMVKHLKAYLGNSFDLKEDDGFNFVSWSHIRSFFYVYSYAYGQIISKSLLSKWQEDKNFKTKIEEFLKAGRSKSPEDIFKSIGINTKDPEFFIKGIKSIQNDIKKLEKIIG